LLPYLIAERHLSQETAGTLVLYQAISSSVIQPAIGLLAGRRAFVEAPPVMLSLSKYAPPSS
jgi:hypothetical protein